MQLILSQGLQHKKTRTDKKADKYTHKQTKKYGKKFTWQRKSILCRNLFVFWYTKFNEQ